MSLTFALSLVELLKFKQTKTTEQYFAVVLFIMLDKVVLNFEPR